MSDPETHGFLETALGRAEQTEAKSRSLVEPIPAITYTEEVDSGRTYAISPEIETILGYAQEEWMGDANLWIDRIHPDDRDRVVGACELANRSGEPTARSTGSRPATVAPSGSTTRRCWSGIQRGSRSAGKGS